MHMQPYLIHAQCIVIINNDLCPIIKKSKICFKASVIFFQIPSLKKLYRDLNFNFKEAFNAYLETKGIWKLYLIFLYVSNSVSKTEKNIHNFVLVLLGIICYTGTFNKIVTFLYLYIISCLYNYYYMYYRTQFSETLGWYNFSNQDCLLTERGCLDFCHQ